MNDNTGLTRRGFFAAGAFAAVAIAAEGKVMEGFEQTEAGKAADKPWQPVSDRKIKVGIAGYGVCKFGAMFGFESHPNVEVVAAADLFSDRCEELAKKVHAKRTYASAEEMIAKDKEIEAVFLTTSAPSHVDLAIAALKRGLNVASAVPALFGEEQLDKAPELVDAVKKSGKIYCMFETSAYHADVYAMREIFQRGDCGKMIYTEGEYYHWGAENIDSYKGWRIGLPPQWYPTHSNAYYTCVTGGHFTDVECVGLPSRLKSFQPKANAYNNPFANETAFFKTSEGGSARMNVFWDMPNAEGEQGRFFTERGYSGFSMLDKVPPFVNEQDKLVNLPYRPLRPQLPKGVPVAECAGYHGGSHGYLTDDFVTAILLNRKPQVDVYTALNTTVPGIYAHRSALKGGEHLKVPCFVA